MENNPSDIQLIEKYLNGELDARAMHKLERRAQDDPFLMEALEGYDFIKADQQDNLKALHTRLEARTSNKVRRMTPWVWSAVAASVVGFAVVLGLLYKSHAPEELSPVAQNQAPAAKADDTTAVVTDKQAEKVVSQPNAHSVAFQKPKAFVIRKKVSGTSTNAPVAIQDLAIAQNDQLKKVPPVSALEEMVGSDIVAAKRQDTILGGNYVVINRNPSSPTVVSSKAKGADMTTRPGKATDNNPSALASAGLPANIMAGAVIDRKDALPLQDGAGKAPAQASEAGQVYASGYSSPAAKKNAGLTTNNGFLSTKSFRQQDSSSQYNSSSVLREVTVIDAKKALNAHPAIGWDKYNKYLQQNAVSTNRTEGIVEVKATINTNGSIAAVSITRGLNIAADAKAISLIQKGPAWIGNAQGKVEEVKIRVTFHK